MAPDSRFPHFNFFQSPSPDPQEPASATDAPAPSSLAPAPPPTAANPSVPSKTASQNKSDKEVSVNVPGFGYLRYIEVPDVELFSLKGMDADVAKVEKGK